MRFLQSLCQGYRSFPRALRGSHSHWAAVVLIAALISVAAYGQHQPKEAARKYFDQGKAEKERAAKVVAYRNAIEADPQFIEAHQEYINTIGVIAYSAARNGETDAVSKAAEQLKKQYEVWIREHPNAPGFVWGMGSLYEWGFGLRDWKTAEKHYRRCTEMAPGFAPCWERLGYVVGLQGDPKTSLTCLQKAAEAWPDSPKYAFAYAYRWRDHDQDRYKALLRAIVERFPGTREKGVALYGLAEVAETTSEKISLLERMAEVPPEPNSLMIPPMRLFEAYLLTDRTKDAVRFAETCLRNVQSDSIRPYWTEYLALARNLEHAQSLMGENKPDDALPLLEEAVRLQSKSLFAEWGPDMRPFVPASAQAATRAKDAARAYALLSKVLASAPSGAALDALIKVGAALGKTPQQVDDDLWKLRSATATQMKEFELTDVSGKKVKLSDYRGRPVMLNFWYPA